MPATADSDGRIKCRACGNTLLWLQDGIVRWEARIRAGERRTFEFPANSPALKDLLVRCEKCGERWTATPIGSGPRLVRGPSSDVTAVVQARVA